MDVVSETGKMLPTLEVYACKKLYVVFPSPWVIICEFHIFMVYCVQQVEIQSGRPHQIRIHLSFIGHPLVGKISNLCVP